MIGACGGLAGCAGFGGPQTWTFGAAELAEMIARQFPRHQPLAGIADVRVEAPRIWLVPERNRIAGSFDVVASDRLWGSALRGQLTMDSAVRFEPADDTIRLTQVRVQQFNLGRDGGGALPLPAQRLGALVAERVLEDLSVYQLKADHVDRLRASGLKTGAVTVTSRGVEVTLAPR